MGRIRFLFILGMAACGSVNTRNDAAVHNDAAADAPPNSALLTVTVMGGGSVSSVPAGISCGTTCSASFVIGTQVTLSATTGSGGTFTSWSGACSGAASTCMVTVGAPANVGAAFACPSGQQLFNFTGAAQTLTRPGCVTNITVDVQGAAGGPSAGGTVAVGGLGGRIQAQLVITESDVINVFVGGAGAGGAGAGGAGGYNGGAVGANNSAQIGGGGGGASDLRLNGSALTDRIIVAGGAGGASMACAIGFVGGNGGDVAGADAPSMAACGAPTNNATGGTQSAGGAGGLYPGYPQAAPGASGTGGAAAATTGGGGAGGGYFGGGGGSWMGGAGGSSYAIGTATAVVHTQGFRAGNGTVTISW